MTLISTLEGISNFLFLHKQAALYHPGTPALRIGLVSVLQYVLVCSLLQISDTDVSGFCTPFKMTKDWEAVRPEIRELSVGQKKSLQEVKEIMEKRHQFRAS